MLTSCVADELILQESIPQLRPPGGMDDLENQGLPRQRQLTVPKDRTWSWPVPGTLEDEFDATLLTLKTTS